MSETYNGFANYQTWLVAVWMDNDPITCSYYKELENSQDIYELAKVVEEDIKDLNPISSISSVYTDLLYSSMSKVDWMQIARHLKSK